MTFDYIPGVECKAQSMLNAFDALKGKIIEVVVAGREHLNAGVIAEETYEIGIAVLADDASVTDLLCIAMETVAENTGIPADLVESIEIRIVDGECE